MGDPRAWWAAARSGRAWLAHHSDPDWAGVDQSDGTTHLGLPADFLIDRTAPWWPRTPAATPMINGAWMTC